MNDTKVLYAEVFFPDVSREFSDAEKTIVTAAFRDAYNVVSRSIGLGREIASIAVTQQIFVEVFDRQRRTRRRLRTAYRAVTTCSDCEDGDSLLIEDAVNSRRSRASRLLFTSAEASALRSLFIPEYENRLRGLIVGIPEIQVIIPLCISDLDCLEDAPFCDNSVEGASWECTPRRGILEPVSRH